MQNILKQKMNCIVYFISIILCFTGCKQQANKLSAADKSNDTQTATKMGQLSNIEKYYIDHLAIRQAIDRYNDIINNRDWKNLPEIFASQSVWEATSPINIKFDGIEEIKTGLPKSVERMEVLIQSTSGIIIHVKSIREATARSLMSEFGRPVEKGGKGIHAVGFYHDQLVKENGEWKFLSRRFQLTYFDTLPVPGKVSDFKY